MRIVLALSHSVEEYQQVGLFHSLGYEVASIGGYVDPAHPHDPKRPALPDVPCHAVVKDAIDAIGVEDNLGAAQARIPDAILEWLGDDGVIVYHHYLQRLFGQWDRLGDWRRGGDGRRIIWRTVGQSVEHNELEAAPYRADGLEVVRYSPRERNIPGYVGGDALIRFWEDPEEWCGWTGEDAVVTNVTQFLKAREPWTNHRFWAAATSGLPTRPAGPGSDDLPDGLGEVSLERMQALLRESRCYLYCGTQPASYTLGLLEALMTGVPVVSIGPSFMDAFPYGPDLFEGHKIVEAAGSDWSDDPDEARDMLRDLLADETLAREVSESQRAWMTDHFGRDVVAAAWRDFLGAP